MYIFSITFTKILSKLIRRFNLGSGYVWPGHLILKIYPKVIKSINQRLPKKVVFISGTNGKTTTAKLIRHIAEKHNLKVLHNDTGANLLNGVVSSVLLSSDLRGNLDHDIAIFELDEVALPKLMKEVEPGILVLLNLSRDQLDRHWEVDAVFEKWLEAVKSLRGETTLILEKAQNKLTHLAGKHNGENIYFDDSVDNLSYTKLAGSFNAKNVNCSLLVAEKMGINRDEARDSLHDFEYAYGRGEKVLYKNKEWRILLAKNPESLNQNLKLLLEDKTSYDSVLYILNDNIPDGLDVSWIYDIEPKLLREVSAGKNIFIAGIRFMDMAVRLQYAGAAVLKDKITENPTDITNIISKHEEVKKIVVLPNYSAMLEMRKVLTGRKIL